jgi:hypothetical protein
VLITTSPYPGVACFADHTQLLAQPALTTIRWNSPVQGAASPVPTDFTESVSERNITANADALLETDFGAVGY